MFRTSSTEHVPSSEPQAFSAPNHAFFVDIFCSSHYLCHFDKDIFVVPLQDVLLLSNRAIRFNHISRFIFETGEVKPFTAVYISNFPLSTVTFLLSCVIKFENY